MIDTHHHLWRYTPQDYPWITPEMGPLRRDFLMEDLRPLLAAAEVTGLVAVQARQHVEETGALIDVAETSPEILGVVGWLPLADPAVGGELERWSAHRKLRGLRHVLQDEPDDEYMLRDDFNAGVARLRGAGLAYDLLIYERHLPQAIRFVDRHPGQVFILDHLAKPRIREGEISPWRERIRDLAARPNVYCKISGMITEAHWQQWSEADLQPYVDEVLEAFGPKRLMFGSDWPVVTLGASYMEWVSTFRLLTGGLSASEREWVEWRTAAEAYTLDSGLAPAGSPR